MNADKLRRYIRDVPDFPKPGIMFRDVTPLLLEPAALEGAIEALSEPFRNLRVDRVLGIESRGFILGAPVALSLGVGFGLVRKAGKLPYQTHRVSYDLEYGTDTVEMHVDTVEKGHRVLIVDDLIATGVRRRRRRARPAGRWRSGRLQLPRSSSPRSRAASCSTSRRFTR